MVNGGHGPVLRHQLLAAPRHQTDDCETQDDRHTHVTRGGEVKQAIEPHAALRTFACGSLSFPTNFIFVFYVSFLLQSVEIL